MAITGRTELVAILGDPVAQASAPRLMNALLEQRGQDAVLVAHHVRAADLAAALAGLRATRNLRGAVVTMPHKSAVVPLLDALSREAREVGACNVVRRERDGRLVGTMLDGEGFVAGLRRAGHDVRGARVFLAGAGGAAAGIAFALGRHGAASLAIHNRTRSAAESLAARMRAALPGFEVSAAGPSPKGFRLVVNATSLGMKPDDPTPLDVAGLEPGALVAEAPIRAEPTRLLAEAAARGCRTHGGLPMLEAQIELMADFVFAAT